MKLGQRLGDWLGADSTVVTVSRILGDPARVRLAWTTARTGAHFKLYANGDLLLTMDELSAIAPATPGGRDYFQVVEVGPGNGDQNYDPQCALDVLPKRRVRLTIGASASPDIHKYRVMSNRAHIV